MKPKKQFPSSQQKLIEVFLANAGEEYIGKTFVLSQQGKNRIKKFSCDTVGFSLDISDSELFLLAQQGYLKIYTDHPSIVFTEKTLEKASVERDTSPTSENKYSESRSQILKVDVIQVYAWLTISLIASAISLILFVMVIQQVLNKNLTIGIISGFSTIASGFLTTVFFKNYDKANERLKYLRARSLNEKVGK